jgi:hypothetical protein
MRGLRRLLILLLVLFALFAVADRVAVHFAQDQAAKQLQSQRHLAAKPSVSIEGFPFLTQLIGSKLDEVRVRADGMTVDHGVRLKSFSADLKGVKVSSDYSSAVADSATGTALISYADLTAALPDHPAVSYAGPGKVKVSVSVDLPIVGKQDLSGTVSPTVRDGSISFAGLDGIAPTLGLSGLPKNLTLESVSPQPDGVAVTVAGTQVALNANS